MRITISDDEGKVVAEHEFVDAKLKDFCDEVDRAKMSKTRKALAFLGLTEDITKKVEDDVTKYVAKLME